MALNWIDKVDGQDDVLADDINSIAHAVEGLEQVADSLTETIGSKINDVKINDTSIVTNNIANIDRYQLVKDALCDGVGEAWTNEEQKAARDRIGEDKYEFITTITFAENSRLSVVLDIPYKKVLLFSKGRSATTGENRYFYINNDYVNTPCPFSASSSINVNNVFCAELVANGNFLTSNIVYLSNPYTASSGYKSIVAYNDYISSVKSSSNWLAGTELKLYGVKL